MMLNPALRAGQLLVRADPAHGVRGYARLGFPGRHAVLSTRARGLLNSRPAGLSGTYACEPDKIE